MPCWVSYSLIFRANEIRGLLMRPMYAATGGMSEMPPNARSSFVRIFMVLRGRVESRLYRVGLRLFFADGSDRFHMNCAQIRDCGRLCARQQLTNVNCDASW